MREILLGFIQGLTEFLPISSSGHLAIIQNFYHGLGETDVLFDILLHVGTLCVVFLYYRNVLLALLKALPSFVFRRSAQDTETIYMQAVNRNLILLIVVGSVPTALIGFGLQSVIKESFSSLWLVACCLLVTGTLLYVADTFTPSSEKKTLSYKEAFIIGTVQGIAVFPGISRSGSTISTGLLLGIERNAAAQFSFLLSIPAILGAVVLEGRDLLTLTQSPNFLFYLIGTLIAFLAGYVAIAALIKIVVRRKLVWFSFYCWVLGGGILLYSFLA